jgi:cystathionine beta-synthase
VYSGGTGRPYLVEGVGEDFWPDTYDRDIADEIVAISDADSFAMTRRLAREEGLLVGGSCGLAVVVAVRLAERLAAAGQDDAVIVALLPDGGRGYMTKVFNDSWMSSYGFLPPESTTATVGDVLRRKDGSLPDLVHTHPNETVGEAVAIMREYGVSQLPVLSAEPPIMAAEVIGAVNERSLLEELFAGKASLSDRLDGHVTDPLPTIGAGEAVSSAMTALADADGALVLVDGKPAGVVTRQDLLAFLAGK